jgi:hypothetical protein
MSSTRVITPVSGQFTTEKEFIDFFSDEKNTWQWSTTSRVVKLFATVGPRDKLAELYNTHCVLFSRVPRTERFCEINEMCI